MHYEIQRKPAGTDQSAWKPMANHGRDMESAITSARYYRSLGRGKQDYRVVVCEGDDVAVILQ